jgi:hypothetical protein
MIWDFRFNGCDQPLILPFDPGSQLSWLGPSPFRHSVSLPSICAWSSIPALSHSCFKYHRNLLKVTFPDSRISTIRDFAFCACSSLESISIPALLYQFTGLAMASAGFRIANSISQLGTRLGERSFVGVVCQVSITAMQD